MNFLLLRTGNSATEVLDTFTKTEILLQILKKIKVLHMCNVAKTLKYLFLHVFQILIIPFKFWRIIQCCGRKMHTVADGKFSSQVHERKYSVRKTFVRGQNLITSLKN